MDPLIDICLLISIILASLLNIFLGHLTQNDPAITVIDLSFLSPADSIDRERAAHCQLHVADEAAF